MLDWLDYVAVKIGAAMQSAAWILWLAIIIGIAGWGLDRCATFAVGAARGGFNAL